MCGSSGTWVFRPPVRSPSLELFRLSRGLNGPPRGGKFSHKFGRCKCTRANLHANCMRFWYALRSGNVHSCFSAVGGGVGVGMQVHAPLELCLGCLFGAITNQRGAHQRKNAVIGPAIRCSIENIHCIVVIIVSTYALLTKVLCVA